MVDDELETLWRAVIDNRDDLAPRLILADALLERGDSRGEIIHLQCDGHPTLRATDADEPSTVYMTESERQVALGERGHEVVASSWHHWFPELSTIVRQHGSWFHEGMLYGIRPHGTREDWKRLYEEHQRELSTVRKVRGMVAGDVTPPDPDMYLHGLICLPHKPEWIDIDSTSIADVLFLWGDPWPTKGLRLRGSVELVGTAPLFPEVEHVELKPVASSRGRITPEEAAGIAEQIRELRALFPKLRTIGFTNEWLQLRMSATDTALARMFRELEVQI